MENLALIYRLLGDLNHLHVDPIMASIGGFLKRMVYVFMELVIE